MLDTIIQLDTTISLFFRELITINSVFAPVVQFLSDFEVIATATFLVGLWLYGIYKKDVGYKIIALDIFYAVIFGFIIYWILQLGLPMRPRPETISALPPLLNHLPDNSFPSGHAIFAGTSIVAIGYFVSFRVSNIFLVLGVLMLLSRVTAGVHYFGDVLVGAILGGILARIYIAIRDGIGLKTPLHTLPLKIASYIKL